MGAITKARASFVHWYAYHPPVFLVFVLSGFLLSPNPVWAFLFYAGVAPLTIWSLWVNRPGAPLLGDRGLQLGLVVIAWFTLTILWGVNQPVERIAKYINAGFMTTIFLLAGVMFFVHVKQEWRERFLAILPAVAAVNAVISFGRHYGIEGYQIGSRLSGWAETRHPILGSSIMAVAVMITLERLLSAQNSRFRVLYGGLLIPEIVFIVLAGSRGAVLTTAIALTVFLTLATPRLLPYFFAGMVTLAGTGWSIPAVREVALAHFKRPSYRLEIWESTLGHVANNPFFGHGVASEVILAKGFTFPHGIYLSALFYGGVIGLSLLLVFFAMLAVRAAKAGRDRPFLMALLTVPVLSGLTDIGQVIKSPSEEWYIVWLPAILVLGITSQRVQARRPIPVDIA